MRRKNFGVLIWLIVCMLLCLAPAAAVWFAPENRLQEQAAVRRVADIHVPGEDVLREMDRLERRIGDLSNPQADDRQNVNLSFLGYVPMAASGHKTGEYDGTIARVEIPYKVSMAFFSSMGSFCVIDGRLYPEGSHLPDGARIMAIESRRVLIEKLSHTEWVRVEAALEPDPAREG